MTQPTGTGRALGVAELTLLALRDYLEEELAFVEDIQRTAELEADDAVARRLAAASKEQRRVLNRTLAFLDTQERRTQTLRDVAGAIPQELRRLERQREERRVLGGRVRSALTDENLGVPVFTQRAIRQRAQLAHRLAAQHTQPAVAQRTTRPDTSPGRARAHARRSAGAPAHRERAR